MSNIYIQEPPSTGKVLLKTTVGDIDIELWTRETPKTCRNFIQLCLEGYYNNTIFHRIVKGFIAQGGDPNGDGSGGESIYGEPFKDEFHQRLRFVRRGLVAMANSGKNDNGSQFFFTFDATPELQNKHTIFGKVTGETVFNMLKLEEGLIDSNERPVYPHKILKTEVLINPFTDIVPRKLSTRKEEKAEKKVKSETAKVKNFKLLSFGEEAEEDEEITTEAARTFNKKGKSSHDLLNDPKLSSESEKLENVDVEKSQLELESIKKKLSGTKYEKSQTITTVDEKSDDEENIDEYFLGKDEMIEKSKKMDDIKRDINNLKRSYHQNKKSLLKDDVETEKHKQISEVRKEYQLQQESYKHLKKSNQLKGSSRESHTLELLKKFKSKLNDTKETDDSPLEKSEETPVDDDEEGVTDNWMSHKLHFEEKQPVLARDANTKSDDWFEIYDPRNPLNKRRREDSKNKLKKKRDN